MPPDGLGVLIGTSEAGQAWLCAPAAANPNVSCPCCWELAPGLRAGPLSAYANRVRDIVGCRVWNANWR